MNTSREVYFNKKWLEFADKIQKRDEYKCLNCNRKKGDVVLQTHHKIYKRGIQIWEYALSDCLTLCKGCHARIHNILEPTDNWELISITDLGELVGICENNGCGNAIRYEHLIYHPRVGYKTVGSTCVELLTKEDQLLSQYILKVYKNISQFAHVSIWEEGYTKNKTYYIYTTYLHNRIRIYGKFKPYSYQIILKIKGEKWHKFGGFNKVTNKELLQVKELAYIDLKIKISNDQKEIEILNNIFSKTT